MLMVFIYILVICSFNLFAAPGDIKIVSVNLSGEQGNDNSYYSSISSDGRYVVFESNASNLVEGDTNHTTDIFVYDRQTDVIERVSVSSRGEQGNYNSYRPFISSDGRYVTFASDASNLVEGDTNNAKDIFVYDRQTNAMERVSVSSNGEQSNGHSEYPFISSDGRYVAFESNASNLVEGDTNNAKDIFVYDRQTDTIERVSVSSRGEQSNDNSYYPSISSNGRYVVFVSKASNLVSNDTNDMSDIFLHDRENGLIEIISVNSYGTIGNFNSFTPNISSNGKYITFVSDASNLVSDDTNNKRDVFVYDRQTDAIERVSVSSDGEQGNYNCFNPFISGDGRYVVYHSQSSTLVPNDTNRNRDVFFYDRQKKITERVSESSGGIQGDNNSYFGFVSLNGRYVAFLSIASNLVDGDTNEKCDIFVKERKVPSSFNAFALILDIPYFLFEGNNYWLNLKLTKSTPLQFELDSFGRNSNMRDSSYSATFNSANKILHVPDFYLDGKTYWLNFELTSSEPIVFTLREFGRN
jgi:Tol biopolymer transport system component